MKSEGFDNYIETQNDEISLGELFLKMKGWKNFLLSRWLIIISFALLGGIVGFAYAYFKKPLFTASTTFVLEEERSGSSMGSLAGLASMAGIDLSNAGGGIFQGDNILELYKSRTMIQKTLLTKVVYNNASELLINHYINVKDLKKKWHGKLDLSKLNFSGSSFTRLQDSILGEVVKDISKNILQVTKPDKKLSIIKVDVRFKDEFFAKSFNNEIVKNVNDFYVQTKTKKSLENINILQSKTDSVRSVMNGDIFSAASVVDATPNLNPTRQVQRVAPAQRSQFSAETNKAILAELVKNLEMSKIAYRKETPLIQIVDAPIFPLEVEKNIIPYYSFLGFFSFAIFIIVFLSFKRGL